MTKCPITLFALAATLTACAPTKHVNSTHHDPARVLADRITASCNATLDRLHAAAARPDPDAYWSCFSADAVFIGTDATERWTLAEFRRYANARFQQGHGWSYTPSNRHIDILPHAHAAMFDETVTNAKYGACRGTGVLIRSGDDWKVAQYHLTLPIPNDLMPEIADRVKRHREQ